MTAKATGQADLREYAASVTSQLGEDGIIAEILNRLGCETKWCVEFGAWDGVAMSNTFALTEHHGYSAVLIEGDRKRAARLAERYRNRPGIIALHRQVGWGAEDSLDAILSETPIPLDFDVLSIDIDGNDYHVWAALQKYRPSLVVIEFNPTIPNGVDFVQDADVRTNQGASISSLVALAGTKGYQLVAATDFNAFFVPDELYARLGIESNDLDVLRTDKSWQSTVFFGYDGTMFLRGQGLIWHRLPLPESIPMAPRAYRGFPSTFGPLRSRLLGRRVRRATRGT
jgi:hypothetical protein